MKKFTWLLAAALPVVLFFSCQKEVATSANRNVQLNSASNCATCINAWEDSRETVVSDAGNNYYIDVANDATKLYITIYRTGTTFTKAKNILVKQGASTIYTNAGPVGAGATTSLSLPAITLNTPFSACTPITISLETVGVGGGGGKVYTEVMYYLRTICVTEVCDLTGYRTQTRGFWGSSPTGINFLSSNWTSAQPATIGCATGSSMTFTTAADATAFIASNLGTPGVLPNGGTFAAQVLTLTINLNLDKNLASFGTGKLGCAIVQVAPSNPLAIWNGYSVSTILDIANDILGGCATNFTPSQLNDIVDAINKNFDDGTVNLGLLTCGVCP